MCMSFIEILLGRISQFRIKVYVSYSSLHARLKNGQNLGKTIKIRIVVV
jgi:hypothetical protein